MEWPHGVPRRGPRTSCAGGSTRLLTWEEALCGRWLWGLNFLSRKGFTEKRFHLSQSPAQRAPLSQSMSTLPWEPFQKHPAHTRESRYSSAGGTNTPGGCADGRALDPSAKAPVRDSEFYTFRGIVSRGLGEGGPSLRVSTKKRPLFMDFPGNLESPIVDHP